MPPTRATRAACQRRGGCLRVYHYHVRKAGGTSINQMFLALSGLAGVSAYQRLVRAPRHRLLAGGRTFVGWNKQLIEQGRFDYAFSHLPAHRLRLPPGTFTITCLRDPVSRVVSHYRMLLEARASADPPSWFADEADWLGDSLGDFIKRLPPEHLLNQLYMFSAGFDVEEAADNIRSCGFHWRTEAFTAGALRLRQRLGWPIEPVHTRRSSVAVDITRAERSRLRRLLEPEYQLLAALSACPARAQLVSA